MGETLNDRIHYCLTGLTLDSVYKFKKNYWICEVKDSSFIERVKIESGHVLASYAETEYESIVNMVPLMEIPDGDLFCLRQFTFAEISKLFLWKYSDNDIWDN